MWRFMTVGLSFMLFSKFRAISKEDMRLSNERK
jgi:hypothetical protein